MSEKFSPVAQEIIGEGAKLPSRDELIDAFDKKIADLNSQIDAFEAQRQAGEKVYAPTEREVKQQLDELTDIWKLSGGEAVDRARENSAAASTSDQDGDQYSLDIGLDEMEDDAKNTFYANFKTVYEQMTPQEEPAATKVPEAVNDFQIRPDVVLPNARAKQKKLKKSPPKKRDAFMDRAAPESFDEMDELDRDYLVQNVAKEIDRLRRLADDDSHIDEAERLVELRESLMRDGGLDKQQAMAIVNEAYQLDVQGDEDRDAYNEWSTKVRTGDEQLSAKSGGPEVEDAINHGSDGDYEDWQENDADEVNQAFRTAYEQKDIDGIKQTTQKVYGALSDTFARRVEELKATGVVGEELEQKIAALEAERDTRYVEILAAMADTTVEDMRQALNITAESTPEPAATDPSDDKKASKKIDMSRYKEGSKIFDRLPGGPDEGKERLGWRKRVSRLLGHLTTDRYGIKRPSPLQRLKQGKEYTSYIVGEVSKARAARRSGGVVPENGEATDNTKEGETAADKEQRLRAMRAEIGGQLDRIEQAMKDGVSPKALREMLNQFNDLRELDKKGPYAGVFHGELEDRRYKALDRQLQQKEASSTN